MPAPCGVWQKIQISVVCSVYTLRPEGPMEERLCFVFLISSTIDGTKGTGTGGGAGICCDRLFLPVKTKNVSRNKKSPVVNIIPYFFIGLKI